MDIVGYSVESSGAPACDGDTGVKADAIVEPIPILTSWSLGLSLSLIYDTSPMNVYHGESVARCIARAHQRERIVKYVATN